MTLHYQNVVLHHVFAVLSVVAAAGALVLPCGGPLTLTPENATGAAFYLSGCGDMTGATEVMLQDGGVKGTAIENMTLFVSDSAHLRVVVENVRLVNSFVSLVNLMYSGNCSACVAAFYARNASIEESTVTLSGVAVGDAALLLVEMSNVTRSSVLVDRCVSSRSGGGAAAVAVESSLVRDSNVTLRIFVAHSQGNARAVMLLAATSLVGSHFAAVSCAFGVNASGASSGSAVFSVVSVDGCDLQRSTLSLRNVSVYVSGAVVSAASLQRLLSVDRTVVASSSVVLSDVDSVSSGVFGTSGSAWSANSSVVLDVFRAEHPVGVMLAEAMRCVLALNTSTLHDTVVAQSAGVVRTHVNATAGVLCMDACRVDRTLFRVRELTVEYQGSASSTPIGTGGTDVTSVVNVVNSTLRLTEMSLSDSIVVATAGPPAVVFSSLDLTESNLTFSSSTVSAPRGVVVKTCQLTSTRIHFSNFSVAAVNEGFRVSKVIAHRVALVLESCNVSASNSWAWAFDASNVTASSIVVERTRMTAASDTILFYQAVLVETVLTLLDSHVSAMAAIGLAYDLLDLIGGGIVVQRTLLAAASDAFIAQRSVLAATQVALKDCYVSAAASRALHFNASNVTASSIVLERTHMTATSYTFAVHQTQMTATDVRLVNSSVFATAPGAWFWDSPSWYTVSVVLQRVQLVATSYTFVTQLGVLHNVSVTLIDSLLSGTSQVWFCQSSNVTASSILLWRTLLTGSGSTLAVQFSSFLQTNLTLIDCNVTALESWAWLCVRSTFIAANVLLQYSRIAAASYAMIWQQSQLIATTVQLLGGSVSASGSRACVCILLNMTSSIFAVQNARLHAESYAFSVQGVLHETTVVLIDCDVTAVSRAWVCVLSNVSASAIIIQRTSVHADNYTLFLQQSVLAATLLRVLDSSVSALITGAVVCAAIVSTTSNIVMERMGAVAASYTILLQQSTFFATNVTLLDCAVRAVGSGSFFCLGSNFTVSSIELYRSHVMGAYFTFLVKQSGLAEVNLLMVNSSVSAAASGAWICDTSNVSASNIRLQGTRLTAGSHTFNVQWVMLMQSTVMLLDSSVSADFSNAWVFDLSSCIEGSVMLLRTSFSAAGGTFVLRRGVVNGTYVTSLDSQVVSVEGHALEIVDIVWSCTTGCGFVSERTILSGAASVVVMQRTTLAAINFSVLDGHLLCSSPLKLFVITDSLMTNESALAMRRVTIASLGTISSDGTSAVLLLLANSTVSHWHLTVADSSLAGATVRIFLLVSNCSVAVCTVSIVNSTLLTVDRNAMFNQNSSPLQTAEKNAAVVLLETCTAYNVSAVLQRCMVVCEGPLFAFSDSSAELRVAILESNISSAVFGGGVFERRSGTEPLLLRSMNAELSRFAGYLSLFTTSSPLPPLRLAESLYRCAWWSQQGQKWRPLSRLHLGAAALLQLPVFAAGNDSSLCGVATVSVFATETGSAAPSGSCSLAPSMSKTHGATASLGTSSRSRSATTSLQSTATPVVAERMLRRVTGSDVGYAAFVGAAISATAVSVVRLGLTAQRVAFVIRSTSRNCGALGNGGADVVDDGGVGVDWLSSPTRLLIGGEDAAAAHRGTVVGNVALCAGVALVAMAAVGCVTRARDIRARVVLSRMHVRHALCAPVLLLLEPTLASSVTLLVSGGSVDVSVGVAGVLCVACAVVALVSVVDPRLSHFQARAEVLRRVPFPVSPASVLNATWRWWTATCVAWHPTAGHDRFLVNWGFLFDDCRTARHWWVLVDVCVSVVLSGLGSVVPGTSSECAVWKWAIVGVACGGAALPIILVPLSSPRAMCECVAMAFLTALIAVLGALDADAAVIEGLSILAALLEWLLIVISALFLRRCRRSEFTDTSVEMRSASEDRRKARMEEFKNALATHTVTVSTDPSACVAGRGVHGHQGSTTARQKYHDTNAVLSQQGSKHLYALQRQHVALRTLVSVICKHQAATRGIAGLCMTHPPSVHTGHKLKRD